MKNVNLIKQKLLNGTEVLGTWSIISNPAVLEIISLSGFDFIILDMEHGIYDVTSLDSCIRVCEANDCSPIVRVPGLDTSAAQWALDLGAHGVIVPQVSGINEVRTAVEMTKFSPAGFRGYNPFTRAASYNPTADRKAGKLNNEFGLTSIIIENKKSIDELEAILTIENLDVIYVGVYDLSIALGFSGNTLHPELVAIVDECIRKIRKANKSAGMMVHSQADVQRAKALGADFLVWSVDTNIIRKGAEDAVQAFRNA